MEAVQTTAMSEMSESLHGHLDRWEDDGGPVAPTLPAVVGDVNGEMPDDLKQDNVIGSPVGSQEEPRIDGPPRPEVSAALMPRDAM